MCELRVSRPAVALIMIGTNDLPHGDLNAFAAIKELIGEKPLVLDREFSYLELLENLQAEQVHFVIRLNLGSHPPRLTDAEHRTQVLQIAQGETEIYRQLYYKDCVAVSVSASSSRRCSRLALMASLR